MQMWILIQVIYNGFMWSRINTFERLSILSNSNKGYKLFTKAQTETEAGPDMQETADEGKVYWELSHWDFISFSMWDQVL